jgi:tetratricopeptide (TPR) repeat protein
MDANALLLAASLLPVRSRLRDLGRVASDGLALLRTPFLSDNDCRDRHAQYFALEANQCLSVGQARAAQCWLEQGLAKYPWQARLRLQMAHPWILRGECGAARQILLPLVGRDDLDPQSRALVCDTIAWSDLMLGDPALLPEADALSQEAFEAVPDSHPFAGTRGAALIELERLDEGFVLLRRALVGNPDAYNKAVNLCYLGLREARRDDAEAARRYLDEARRLDPRCPVLERIARLVEARTASIVPDVVDVLPASPSAERRAPL